MKSLICLAICIVFFLSCKSTDGDSELQGIWGKKKKQISSQPQKPLGQLNRCVAIRGNGHYVIAHFGALAAVTEQYGIFDGMVGASSATITMFMYDHMLENQYFQRASGRQKELIMATMVKSIAGWIESYKNSKDIKSINTAVEAFGKLFAVLKQEEQAGMLDTTRAGWKASVAAARLHRALSSEELRNLVDAEALKMLSNPTRQGYASYEYKIKEFIKGIKNISSWKANDADLYFRQGIFDFKGLSETAAHLAEFYSMTNAFAPKQELGSFLSQCAHEGNVGKTWGKLVSKNKSYRCEQAFVNMATKYRAELAKNHCRNFTSRVTPSILRSQKCFEAQAHKQPIGKNYMVIGLTGVLKSQSGLQQFEKYRQAFKQNTKRPLAVPINFSKDVVFGYMPSHKELEQRFTNLSHLTPRSLVEDYRNDYKTKRYESLGRVSYETMIFTSAAEPGLSGVQAVPGHGKMLNLGGWTDVHPTISAKLAGCKEVFFIGRKGGESFIVNDNPLKNRPRDGVSEVINMTEQDRIDLHDAKNPQSSYRRHFRDSDAIWCTDWNNFTDLQQFEMYAHSYSEAQLFVRSRSKSFAQSRAKLNPHPVSKIPNEPILGCIFGKE